MLFAPSSRYEFCRSPAPLAEMRTAPGIDLPVSSLTDDSTVPATSVCSRATSRPAIGSSTMRA